MGNDISKILEFYFGDDFITIDKNKKVILQNDVEMKLVNKLNLTEDNVESIKEQEEECVFLFSNMEEELIIRDNISKNIKEYNKNVNKKENIKKNEIINKMKSSHIIYEAMETKRRKLRIKESHNYVENNINGVKSKTYSISIYELIDFYKDMGNKLFERNVRIGLADAELERSFKEVLSKEVYSIVEEVLDNIDKNSESSTKKKKLVNEFEKMNFNGNSSIKANEFYLYHNGISVVYNGKFNNNKNELIIEDCSKFSVINGAQTISTLAKIYYDLKNMFKDFDEDIQDKFSSKLEELFREIEVLATISYVDENFDNIVDNISKYKNVQIKIKGVDTFTKEAKEINVKYVNTFKVVRPGENHRSNLRTLSMLDLMKKYIAFKEKPGKSKNLNAKDLKKTIEEFKDENEGFEDFFDMMIQVQQEWKNYFINRENSNIFKYGQTYFISYLWHIYKYSYKDLKNEITDFNDDVKEFEALVEEVNLNNNVEFDLAESKKNEFFKKIIKKYEEKLAENKSIDFQMFNKFYENELKNNTEGKSKNNKSNIIKKYYLENNIKQDGFRTVTLNEEDKLSEQYVLGSSYFMDMMKIYETEKDIKKREAKLKEHKNKIIEELKKPIRLFVFKGDKFNKTLESFVIWQEDEREKFEKFYAELVTSFDEQEFESMPKISDNLNFHIRPKSQNSFDVFKFTDGKSYPKQALWVNKEVIEKRIKKN